MIEEEQEFDIIDLAYSYLIAAFELLGDADLFEIMSEEVSVHYDEYLEDMENDEYGDRILELCLNGK